MSEENENKKSGLTVGGVSGSKKMRLGRVHKKKTDEAEAPAAPVAAGAGSPIKAPLPGTIIELKVNVGDTVKKGDVVLVLEAMKMQNNIESEFDGTVTSITVKQGETVMEGAVLLTIG